MYSPAFLNRQNDEGSAIFFFKNIMLFKDCKESIDRMDQNGGGHVVNIVGMIFLSRPIIGAEGHCIHVGAKKIVV
jgi:hypothetical protein